MIIQKKLNDLFYVLGLIFIIMFLAIFVPGVLTGSIDKTLEFIFFEKSPVMWGESKLTELTFFEIDILITITIGLMTLPFYIGEIIKIDSKSISYFKLFEKPRVIEINDVRQVRYEKSLRYMKTFATVDYDLILQGNEKMLVINSIVCFPATKIKEMLDDLKKKNKSIVFSKTDKIYSSKWTDYLPDW